MFHIHFRKDRLLSLITVEHKIYKPKKNILNKTDKRSWKSLPYSSRAQFEQPLIFNTTSNLECLKTLIFLRQPRNEVHLSN